MDDFKFHSATLALVGGVKLSEMRTLELRLLSCVNFDVWVDPLELYLLQTELVEEPFPSKKHDYCYGNLLATPEKYTRFVF